MSACVAFPQVRRISLLGSSPTRPTTAGQEKRSDLRKRVFRRRGVVESVQRTCSVASISEPMQVCDLYFW